MEGIFQPLHLLIILLIVVILFGGRKLPELGKGLGEAIRGFKSAMREADAPDNDRRDNPPPPSIGSNNKNN